MSTPTPEGLGPRRDPDVWWPMGARPVELADLALADDAFTDDELAALALAADPDAPIPDDAVPLRPVGGHTALLPAWYMPVPAGSQRTSWRAGVVAGIVVAMLVLSAVGVCVTYGLPDPVW